MKKIIALSISLIVILLSTGSVYAQGFTNDIAKESFEIKISEFFPSFGSTEKIESSSGKGINNVKDLIISMIPMLTTMMAVGATLMVIW